MLGLETIHVGVARVVLGIPGARTLKDRRQAVRSVVDRLRHRFEVSVHEVGESELPGRQTLVITTAGNDARLIRSILDRAVAFALDSGKVQVQAVDVDVFRWQSETPRWEGNDE
jgi:uncharacterized protein YlxP (DUF503 family)